MNAKYCLSFLNAAFFVSLPAFLLVSALKVTAETPQITCASDHGKTERCPMTTTNGVVLVEQLSRASCEGNWDYGQGYVEVRNGCRATFAQKQRHDNHSASSENGLLKARAAYDTILLDTNANFVIGVAQGQMIYINCSDLTRIEGDKRVFAMDLAGNRGYILVNAVDGATCNW